MAVLAKGKITRQDWAFVGITLGVTALLFVAFYLFGYTKLKIESRHRKLKLCGSVKN